MAVLSSKSQTGHKQPGSHSACNVAQVRGGGGAGKDQGEARSDWVCHDSPGSWVLAVSSATCLLLFDNQSAVKLSLTTREVGKMVALWEEAEESMRGVGYGSVELLPWQSPASQVRGWGKFKRHRKMHQEQ